MAKTETKTAPDVDAILAAAGGKMAVAAPPTGNAATDIARVGGGTVPIARSTTAPQVIETEVLRVTGPLDFDAMKKQRDAKTVVPQVQNIPVAAVVMTDDVKYGKAFKVALKTAKKFKIDTVPNFISLVEEVKENL